MGPQAAWIAEGGFGSVKSVGDWDYRTDGGSGGFRSSRVERLSPAGRSGIGHLCDTKLFGFGELLGVRLTILPNAR